MDKQLMTGLPDWAFFFKSAARKILFYSKQLGLHLMNNESIIADSGSMIHRTISIIKDILQRLGEEKGEIMVKPINCG